MTEIRVYSAVESDWQITLDGSAIGGVSTTISKSYLEEALACTFGSNHKVSYTDTRDRTWEGMPLWFFAGFVDDADQHSPYAFNQTLADKGYLIRITGTDGYNATIPSRLISRNSSYLLANSLNGTHISESDENWPLRFTGAGVSGSMTVKGVTSVVLIPTGSIAVTSAPPGAKIFLDGTETAFVTPHTFADVNAGSHSVYVTLNGYVTPPSQDVLVVMGETAPADFTLVTESGSIAVTSAPSGAEIFLDGSDAGHVTPYTLTGVPAGQHSVVVTLSGHIIPAPVQVVVRAGETVPADFLLVRQIGSISVTSAPAGAKIFLNGTDTGAVTPFTLTNVPIGEHSVSITLPGYFTPEPVRVIVSAGQTSSADFLLTPVGTGSIRVTSAPAGAAIFIDGEPTGILTPETITDVPAGNHEVYVARNGYLTPNTMTVTVSVGKKTTVHFKLEKDTLNYGSVRVTSAPAGAAIYLDGVNSGKVTPDTLTDVPAGSHTVDVALSGYTSPGPSTVRVEGKKEAGIHFNLKIKPRIILS